MKGPKGLAILGSTGSIGTSTLDIVRRHPDRFRVVALAAGSNVELLKRQAGEFRPLFVSVGSEDDVRGLGADLPEGCSVGFGVEGASTAATHDGVDCTVAAISGAAGLVPTMAAIRAGKDVALANKETLVLAGPLVMEEVKSRGARLLPVDSEHSAVFQSLCGHRPEDVERVILTASGGPFLDTPATELGAVTPELALRHPKWSMGRKITIDSATLVNKGLEVIEARWLFGLPPERISVVIHPQSIVHSMVEYLDGSMVAQLSTPDMKGPIAYALAYPERIDSTTPRLDLAGLSLDFREPDPARFPCLGLAYDALDEGGVMPAVLNAADEVAVEAFLKGALGFTDIHRVIAAVMEGAGGPGPAAPSLEEILEADRAARASASELVKCLT
ncbi:MAG: 1-deoxy-D-xylulose-5-phosphate reductoisomerase [Thermodesulfobacteriota bacterium]